MIFEMARQIYEEPYNPRKLPLPQQKDYYQALSRFWDSVADKYPNAYNRYKATIFSRDLKRVEKEIQNE